MLVGEMGAGRTIMKQNRAQGRGVMGLEGGGWIAESVYEDRTWGLRAEGYQDDPGPHA